LRILWLGSSCEYNMMVRGGCSNLFSLRGCLYLGCVLRRGCESRVFWICLLSWLWGCVRLFVVDVLKLNMRDFLLLLRFRKAIFRIKVLPTQRCRIVHPCMKFWCIIHTQIETPICDQSDLLIRRLIFQCNHWQRGSDKTQALHFPEEVLCFCDLSALAQHVYLKIQLLVWVFVLIRLELMYSVGMSLREASSMKLVVNGLWFNGLPPFCYWCMYDLFAVSF